MCGSCCSPTELLLCHHHHGPSQQNSSKKLYWKARHVRWASVVVFFADIVMEIDCSLLTIHPLFPSFFLQSFYGFAQSFIVGEAILL